MKHVIIVKEKKTVALAISILPTTTRYGKNGKNCVHRAQHIVRVLIAFTKSKRRPENDGRAICEKGGY